MLNVLGAYLRRPSLLKTHSCCTARSSHPVVEARNQVLLLFEVFQVSLPELADSEVVAVHEVQRAQGTTRDSHPLMMA